MNIIAQSGSERIEYLGFGEKFITYFPTLTSDGLAWAVKELAKDMDEEAASGFFLRNVITVRVGQEGDAILAFFADGTPPTIVYKEENDATETVSE